MFQNLRIVLRSEGRLVHLEQPMTHLPYPVASQATRDAYEALNDAQNEVACLMIGSMSPALQRTLENYTAYDMMKELKIMFEEQAQQELFETVKHSTLANKRMISHLILNSLNEDCDQFIQNYNMHSMGKTLAELHAILKLYEKGILKKVETPAVAKGKAKGKNKLAYAPKTKITSPPKRDNPEKDSICHHCKEVSHWRRNCPSYHVELKKRKNASGLRESRKLKHGALSLYMGNGMRAAVEAIK
nr:hypothetical protein [Tanacetum cinerariifolium]